MTKNWLDEAAEEVAEQNRKAFDALDTPEARARLAEKAKAEFDRGVRLGWHDENGEPLEVAEEE